MNFIKKKVLRRQVTPKAMYIGTIFMISQKLKKLKLDFLASE